MKWEIALECFNIDEVDDIVPVLALHIDITFPTQLTGVDIYVPNLEAKMKRRVFLNLSY